MHDGEREIVEVEGDGYKLIECIQRSLQCEHRIIYSKIEIINKVAEELLKNPDYTKYYKTPIENHQLNRNISEAMSSKYGRVLVDVYLPALSSALDLHIKICEEIHGYVGVVTTKPLHPSAEKKFTMLVWKGDRYAVILRKEASTIVTSFDISQDHPYIANPDAVKTPTKEIVEKQSNSQDIDISQVHHQEVIKMYEQTYKIKVPKPSSNEEQSQKESCTEARSPTNKTTDDNTIQNLDSDDEEPFHNPTSDELLGQAKELISGIQKKMQEPETPLPNIPGPISKGKFFNMAKYKDIVPEVVDKLPHDLDGVKLYIMDCSDSEGDTWQKKYKDGRYFQLNTSKRKGFRGQRRIGKCQGNYECSNPRCPILVSTGVKNKHQLKKVGGEKFCFSCEDLCFRKPCHAIKLIEYSAHNNLLTVYHDGNHSCSPKVNSSMNDAFLEEAIKETNGNVGPRELAKMKMTNELLSQKRSGQHDMGAIVNIASQFTDSQRIANLKKKINSNLKQEVQSLAAVGDLKAVTDTTDKYYIYRINDQNLNGNLSYVFKSSRKMAELAIKMDHDSNGEDPMKNEVIYFDGMHKRVKQWKTLTAWAYHPPTRRLLRYATMECKGETTESVTLFWQLFNRILQEVKCDENYKFNPKAFITDEAGANINGIAAAFGYEAIKKTYTCQFHFKNCLNQLLRRIPGELEEIKNEVENLAYAMTTVATLAEYSEIKRRLTSLGGVIPCIESWFKWWDAHRFHLFPVFRGYNISSVNMAEIGHSTLKHNKPIMLVDSCWEDTCSMVIQEEELQKFLDGVGKSSGKGPTAASLATREKRSQMKRAQEYKANFQQGNFMFCENDDEVFIPSKKAKHKAPTLFSSSNPTQGLTVPAPLCERSSSQMNTNLDTIQSVFEEPGPSSSPGQKTQKKATFGSARKFLRENHPDNSPILVFLQGFNIKVCFGCKKKFEPKMRNPPHDIICKRLVTKDRLINNQWVPGWQKSWGYFHLSLDCLRKSRTDIEASDIYIPNDVMGRLTQEHIDMLVKKGWWSIMRRRDGN